MVSKWAVYVSTYATYSAVHSIRTCFASLKTMLNAQPFRLSESFLGALDMFVLFAIAILLYVFGGDVERYPRRKILFPMLIGLIINLIILFLILIEEVQSKPLYIIFYGSVGVLSSLAWPVCLYTTAQYFDSHNPMALSMYSSVSQFGDFLAFMITLLIISAENIKGAYSMLVMAAIFVCVTGYDYYYFKDREQEPHTSRSKDFQQDNGHGHSSKKHGKCKFQNHQHVIEGGFGNQNPLHVKNALKTITERDKQSQLDPKTLPHIISKQFQQQPQVQSVQSDNGINSEPKSNAITNCEAPISQHPLCNNSIDMSKSPVNAFSVWTLPGVALPVLALACVKAVNAIIVSWLVLYFNKLNMVKQSRIFAIVWTFSIVLGGFVGAKINSALNYRIFVICLLLATFLFFILEELHVNPHNFEVVALVSVCGVLVGGPYYQLTTAVPLKLCENPEISTLPKARSCLISMMEGFSILLCAICVLIVPGIGITKLNFMASALCFISVLLLVGEQVRNFVKRKQLVQQNL